MVEQLCAGTHQSHCKKGHHHPQELILIVMPLHIGNISHWGFVGVELEL